MDKNDAERFAAINAIQEQLFEALGKGQMQTTITLDTLAWIAVMQEVKNRNPRNYSQLLRDDMMERMDAVIERLHEEVTYLATAQPGPVAKRTDPHREPPPPRSSISGALQKNLRGKP